jgi:hypothetical protein
MATRTAAAKTRRPVKTTRVAKRAQPRKSGTSATRAPEVLQVAAEEATPAKKAGKAKQVRDSFSMPKEDFAVLKALKARAERLGRPAKKSELLRAGVHLLAAQGDAAFLASVARVPPKKA